MLIQDCRSNERASNSGRCCDFDTSYHLNPIRANWNPGDNHFHGAHIKNVICSGGSGVHFTQKHPILCRYGARRSEYCNEKEKYHVRVNFDWNFYISAITSFVRLFEHIQTHPVKHLNISKKKNSALQWNRMTKSIEVGEWKKGDLLNLIESKP